MALEDDETWMIDPFMQGLNTFIDNMLILDEFYIRVIESGLSKEEFEIYWIMGTDNFGGLPDFLIQRNYKLILVENRNQESK